MFKRLFSDNRIFIAAVCLLVFIAAGLLYLQTVKRDAQREVQRTQEIVTQRQTPTTQAQPARPKPPPPGETAETGHWHGDVWHTQPHEAPAEGQRIAQEPLADTNVQGAPVIAQQANGQIDAPTQEASPRTQETGEARLYGPEWAEWFKKEMEISDELTRIEQKLADALEAIDAETEAEFKREMRRILSEIDAEMGEAVKRQQAHQSKEPGRNSGDTSQRSQNE